MTISERLSGDQVHEVRDFKIVYYFRNLILNGLNYWWTLLKLKINYVFCYILVFKFYCKI